MKLNPISPALALCALSFWLPSEAAPPAGDRSRADVLIVVDAERNLALVPEGTVIPDGLSVSFGMGETVEQANPGRLVFAYAGDETFTKARLELAAAAVDEPADEPVDEPQESRQALSTTACISRNVMVYLPTGGWHASELRCLSLPTPSMTYYPSLTSRLLIPVDPLTEYPRVNASLRTSSPQLIAYNASAAGASVNGSGAFLRIDRCCYGSTQVFPTDIYSNASEHMKYCQMGDDEPTVCNLHVTSQISFRFDP